jgi:hypothetical protein
MEAISNKTGKVFTGKLATIMLRIGVASTTGKVKPAKVVKPKKVKK